jgi:hypothetical protein
MHCSSTDLRLMAGLPNGFQYLAMGGLGLTGDCYAMSLVFAQ